MSKAFFSALRRGFFENVRFAKTAIFAHKLRAALTVLGIVIGVSTVIAMVSLIAGFNNSVTASFESFGATLVQFQRFDPQFGPDHGGRDPEMRKRKVLTYEDAIALKAQCPSLRSVSPERYWFAGNSAGAAPTVNFGGEEATPDTIVGVIDDYLDANSKQTGEGRFINDTDVRRSANVIVIGFDIADALFPFVDPIGKWVMFGGRRYEVVGVMEAQGSTMFESTDAHVFLPITSFDQAFPWVKDEFGVNIATVPKNPQLVQQAIEEGTNVLRLRRGVPFNKPNDFGIMTPDKLIGNFQAVTGGVALTMLLIASISLLVGGVGVMNIMLVSVTERTKEIGLRKALGAIRQDILTQFLIEAVTLSAVGGVIGVAVGLGIALLVRTLSPLAAAAPFWSIAVGLGVSMTVGLVFGIFPAYRAAKLDPIDALRYE
ncbi:MAG: ABC transporter permease [Thermoanaerobaculia bacterium]|nr:ABC transporter permease [Thermoanaerobaculia bacterium]